MSAYGNVQSRENEMRPRRRRPRIRLRRSDTINRRVALPVQMQMQHDANMLPVRPVEETPFNSNAFTSDEAADIDEIFVNALRRNDVAAVQQAIRTGADVNAVHQGTTPLFEACENGANDEIVRLLLDAGADPRWTYEWYAEKLSPTEIACHNGHLSIVEILINHDNSLLECSDNDDYDESLLLSAISREQVNVVRFLIHRGTNVNAKTRRTGTIVAWTPLLLACQMGGVEIVRLLLAAGAEMNMEAPDSIVGTALHVAVRNGHIEILRELILRHNANMCALDSSEKTPFDVASTGLFLLPLRAAIIDFLLQIYGSKMAQQHSRLTIYAIFGAATYSFVEAGRFHPPINPLRIILPLGTLTLNHFRTLLHSLNTDGMIRNPDESGTLPIHIACRTNAPVEVLALLSELDPATLQIADYSGGLPLHECCRGNVDYSSVRYLVEQVGVGTLAARNHQGAVPLHVLCGSTNPSLRTVQYLIRCAPGSVAARTNAGQYPFLIAAGESSTASLSVVYELVRANPHLVVPG